MGSEMGQISPQSLQAQAQDNTWQEAPCHCWPGPFPSEIRQCPFSRTDRCSDFRVEIITREESADMSDSFFAIFFGFSKKGNNFGAVRGLKKRKVVTKIWACRPECCTTTACQKNLTMSCWVALSWNQGKVRMPLPRASLLHLSLSFFVIFIFLFERSYPLLCPNDKKKALLDHFKFSVIFREIQFHKRLHPESH